MAKIKFLPLVGTLTILSFFSCEKETTIPEQVQFVSTLKSDIVLHNATVNFEAKGNQVNAQNVSASGLLAKKITGTVASSPRVVMGITLAGITTPGVYTNRNNVILTVSLDASNPTAKNVFSSELGLSVNVTAITDKEMSGTFTAKILNEEGTLSGFVRNGEFKVKF